MKKDIFYAAGSAQAILIGMVVLIICIYFLPEKTGLWVIKEGGIIEGISPLAWFAIVPLVFVYGKSMRHWSLAALPLFFAMRELDLHKEWSADSVLKSRYWLSDLAGTGEKVIVATILIIWLLVIIASLIFHAASFITALRARRRLAVNIFASGSLLFISKIFLDGMERKATALGIEINVPHYVTITEEVMEMTAALLVLAAVLSIRRELRLGR